MKIRTYTELIRIPEFEDRFRYLQIRGEVGAETFGWERYLNQILYHSKKWRRARRDAIIRDEGCDLAHEDYEIHDRIIVHHLNPLTPEQIEEDSDLIYDLEFLVCTTDLTHKAIHYGDANLLPKLPVERRPGDTCPWK